jgi:hypothetical protein
MRDARLRYYVGERDNDVLAERLRRMSHADVVAFCDRLLVTSPDLVWLAIGAFEPYRRDKFEDG